MIVDTKEAQCTIKVLTILSSRKARYNQMFKATKVSHTTIQSVLRELVNKKYVKREGNGPMKVDYEITEKGKEFLNILIKLEQKTK
jgi:DNA-binding HxlR family transcriptional regulator